MFNLCNIVRQIMRKSYVRLWFEVYGMIGLCTIILVACCLRCGGVI